MASPASAALGFLDMGAEIGDLGRRSGSVRFAGMILTCPDCATRYFVPDEKVGASGRAVKCSSCGNRWTAYGDPALELFADSEEGALAREESDVETPEPAAISELPGEELPKVFRQRADTERRVREAATAGVVWAIMSVALVAVIGAAALFRVDVVRLWPASASAYAFARMPVNSVGLTIENVRAEAALQDSHAALAVSGVLRNVEDHPVTAPALRIALRNKAGKVVLTQIANPADPTIPPGETRHFAVALLDPPTTAAQLEVGFEANKARAAHGQHAAAPEPRRVALRGPAAPAPLPEPQVVEAEPLPADAPEALPGHH